MIMDVENAGERWNMDESKDWDSSSKHNRRKQLKPIRMFSNGVGDGQTSELVIQTAGHDEGISLPSEAVDHQSEGTSNTLDNGQENELSGEAAGCGFCGQQFTSQTGLQMHVQKMHLSPDSGFAMDTDAAHTTTEPSPTNQSATDTHISPKDDNTSVSSKALDETKKKDGKIFHQDAYCEVCDREFCNKYFLKTHKANKHGIYDANDLSFGSTASMVPPQYSFPSAPVNGPSPTLKKNPDNGAAVSEFCHVCGMLMPSKEHLEKHILEAHTSNSNEVKSIPSSLPFSMPPSLPSLPSALNSYNPLAVPTLQNVMLMGAAMNPLLPFGFLGSPGMQMPLGPFGNLPSLTSTASNVIKQGQSREKGGSGGILNADAFCNYCQKEFCNRYFLRTHLANKHNVTMESPVGSANGDAKSETGPINLSARASPASNRSEPPPQQTAALNLSMKQETSPANGQTCSKCMQEFSSGDSLKNHIMMGCHKLKPLKSAADSTATTVVKQNDDSKVAMAMFESMMAAKMADRVECDICHKDYCNKYFLKTHKKKFHGVDTDAIPIKQEYQPLKISQPKQDPVQNLKTEPLQVPIKREPYPSAVQGLGLDMKPSYNGVTSPHDMSKLPANSPILQEVLSGQKQILSQAESLALAKANLFALGKDPISSLAMSEPFNWAKNPLLLNEIAVPTGVKKDSTECNFCGLNFQSAEKLLDHKLTSHADQLERTDDEVKKWRWKQPSSMARVMCDVCNKELCNKYFLRIHKMNKHGVNDPSLPQRSSKISSSSSVSPTDQTGKGDETNRASPQVPNESLLREIKAMCQVQNNQQRSQQTVNGPSAPLRNSENDLLTNRYFSHFTEVCKICDRRFKSAKWLQTHMMKDHPQQTAQEKTPDSSQVCAYCGMILENVDAFLKHMSQVHSESNKQPIKTHADTDANANQPITDKNAPAPPINERKRKIDDAPSAPIGRKVAVKVHKCTHCDYRSRWLSNIYSHEERRHGTSRSARGTYSCLQCMKAFRYAHSWRRHVNEFHSSEENPPVPEDTPKAPKRKSRFQNQGCTYSCSECNFKTRVFSNLKQHSTKHETEPPVKVARVDENVLQKFKLCSQDENFRETIVHLPVKRRMDSATMVSFTLVPTE